MSNAGMATTLLGVMLGALVVACASPAVRGGGEKDWTLRAAAVGLQESGESTIWIGLKNNQTVSGLVCIRARSYGSGEGRTRIFSSRTTTHACTADQTFWIVPAGETLYTPWSLELPTARDNTTRMDVSLTVRERSPIHPDSFQDVEVEWKGTLGDMLKLGAELFKIDRLR